MSLRPEILANLEKYPIETIITLFRDEYTKENAQYCISKLFFDLFHHMAHFESNDDLTKLRQMFSIVISKIMNHDNFALQLQPLVDDILQNQDEARVFTTAIELAQKLGKENLTLTSDPSFRAPSKCRTTINHSISEVPGFSKTVESLTAALKAELNSNVIVDIDNFWEVLFLNKEWSDQTLKIWESYKAYESKEITKQHEDPIRRQKQYAFPEDVCEEIPKKVYANQILRENMTEDEMWDWLEFFREKFLSQLTDQISKPSKQFPSIIKEREGTHLRSNYFRSKQCTMKGTDHKYQADFLTKAIGLPGGTRHQWRDVRVLGEFSNQDDSIIRNKKFGQLSRLALEVFYTQPIRHFVHGFCTFRSTFELWVFNRSGAYGSGKLTLKDDKEKFVRAICSYLLMSDQELGIDSSIQQVNGRSFVSVCDKNLGKTQQFEINPYPFFTAGSLVTRGTTCFESLDQNAVVKYSWVRIPGESEIKFLQRSRGTEGVVEYIAADAICTIGDHLKDLNFSMAKYWNVSLTDTVISQGTGVQVPRTPMLRDRELRRIVVTPRGRSLRSSKTILEFLTGIRDTIEAHHRLYVDKKILHGDISDGNIILATVNGKMQGILIDLDHAENVEETGSKDEKHFLTGTMRFMALERLQYAANFKQTIIRTYHHDLESFFYIFILGCMTYERDKKSKVVSQLNEWSNANVMKSYHAKNYSVLSFKELILDHFSKNFEALKDLARELRMILFTNLPDNFSTYKDHDVEYEELINAFNNTIGDIKEGRITDKNLVRGSS